MNSEEPSGAEGHVPPEVGEESRRPEVSGTAHEGELARLLTSVALRGGGSAEACRLLGIETEGLKRVGLPSIAEGAGWAKAEARKVLGPLRGVPIVTELRRRIRDQLDRLTTSVDDDLINRAARSAHAGRFGDAMRMLERAGRINPRNSRIGPHLGRIQFLISRSRDARVPVATKAMLDALDAMNAELGKRPLYSAGEFWLQTGAFHVDLLKLYGLENFKRTVSHNYQNWLMVDLEDAQVQRIFQTWAQHRSIDPFVNTMEHPNHVGFHLERFDRPEYPLANEGEREIYRLAVGLLWEHVLHGDTHKTLEPLEELEVGNPVRIRRRGRLISSDLAHSARERNLFLDQLGLNGQEGLIVGELGAGHGRLAEIFGRTTNYRYFIFDIAPALYVSQSYIQKIFPDEKVFCFRAFENWAEVRDEVGASRFAFFTANQLEFIPRDSIHLFINMNSLMEMRAEQIRNFLMQIGRVTTKAFLSRQWFRWRNQLDDLTVARGDFVLAEGWRKALDCTDDVYPEFFNQIWERK
jgi:putative sugar O-methyltransferase